MFGEHPEGASSCSQLQVISSATGSQIHISGSAFFSPNANIQPTGREDSPGTQMNTCDTELLMFSLPHFPSLNRIPGSCPESLPPPPPTPPLHPLSFILPGRITVSPLNCLSPSHHHLHPQMHMSRCLSTRLSLTVATTPACEELHVLSSRLPHQDTAFHCRLEALQSAPLFCSCSFSLSDDLRPLLFGAIMFSFFK